MLGMIYTQYPFLKLFFSEAFEDNHEMINALNAIEYTLEFFEYTHLSEGKISNSALIMIYTVLTQNLNMNGDKAYKSAKYLVEAFVDGKDYPLDSYRQSK